MYGRHRGEHIDEAVSVSCHDLHAGHLQFYSEDPDTGQREDPHYPLGLLWNAPVSHRSGVPL